MRASCASSNVGTTFGGSGFSGMRQWMADIDEQFAEWDLEATRWESLGDERYVAVGRVKARGRSSGLEIDWPMLWLFELQEGMLRRMTARADVDAALAEFGLESG